MNNNTQQLTTIEEIQQPESRIDEDFSLEDLKASLGSLPRPLDLDPDFSSRDTIEDLLLGSHRRLD